MSNNDANAKMAELQAQLAKLQAENEALKAKATEGVFLKVSDKGAVSLYGVQRFPVTLYGSQWETVLAMGPQIQSFIKANSSKLKTKEQAIAERDAERKANAKLEAAARVNSFQNGGNAHKVG